MPMEELYVFGTGNAQATRWYNTCFCHKDGDEYFMVDAGEETASCASWRIWIMDLCHIHNIFVTHEAHGPHHGYCVDGAHGGRRRGKREYEGELQIYCHRAGGYHLHHLPSDDPGPGSIR